MATLQRGVGSAPSDALGVNAPDLTVKKSWIFELTQKTHSNAKLIVGGKESNDRDIPYPPYLSLKNPVMIYDPETKRSRWARFLEGYNTFWQDEQDELKLPKNVIENPWIPAFKDGFMFLQTPQDSQKVKFMLMHDQYDGVAIRLSGKPAKFKLASKESQATDDLDYLEKKQKAFSLAIEADTDVMLAHAKYLGIKATDAHGEPLTDKAIKVAYVRKAESDPFTFLKSYDNPLTNVAYLVSEAISDGRITLSHVKGQAHWEDTKALITIIDSDEKPVDFLAQFALSSKGSDFMKRISKK